MVGIGAILYDDDNNGSMVLKEGWTWLEGSPSNEDYYGKCDSCSEKLDAYYTGYVVDGTAWSICMECFDKMPGREGVMIEHQNGKKSVDFKNTYNAEETMLGSIGEGNDFGQMEAEEDYYTRDATFVCPESDCGCRGCYGCMGEDENPNCRCCGY